MNNITITHKSYTKKFFEKLTVVQKRRIFISLPVQIVKFIYFPLMKIRKESSICHICGFLSRVQQRMFPDTIGFLEQGHFNKYFIQNT